MDSRYHLPHSELNSSVCSLYWIMLYSEFSSYFITYYNEENLFSRRFLFFIFYFLLFIIFYYLFFIFYFFIFRRFLKIDKPETWVTELLYLPITFLFFQLASHLEECWPTKWHVN